MEILDILKQQRDILSELNDIVKEEKQVLIRNDNRALSVLLEKKVDLINRLDETEQKRLSAYGEMKISEIEIPQKDQKTVDQIVKEIKDIYEEVKEYQEINMLLTHQSIEYNNNMMYIIQQALLKSGSGYSEDGKMKGDVKTKPYIDESV
ncbi:MAG: flagellar protein FlgN [Clostridiales bacterium]|nr:flagellar protein FlgN [Clostridiales bacterium]